MWHKRHILRISKKKSASAETTVSGSDTDVGENSLKPVTHPHLSDSDVVIWRFGHTASERPQIKACRKVVDAKQYYQIWHCKQAAVILSWIKTHVQIRETLKFTPSWMSRLTTKSRISQCLLCYKKIQTKKHFKGRHQWQACLRSTSVSDKNCPRGEWKDVHNCLWKINSFQPQLETGTWVYSPCCSQLWQLKLKLHSDQSQTFCMHTHTHTHWHIHTETRSSKLHSPLPVVIVTSSMG